MARSSREIRNEADGLNQQHFGPIIAVTGLTLLSMLLSLAIGLALSDYLGLLALMLSLGFIGVPACFAMAMQIYGVRRGTGTIAVSEFFRFFGQYYSYGFYGSFHLVNTFLLMALVFAGGLVASAFIYSVAAQLLNPGFSSMILDLSILIESMNGTNDDVEAFNAFLSNPMLVQMSNVCLTIAGGSGLMYFTHSMSIGFYRMLWRIKDIKNPRACDLAFKMGLRTVRRDFNKLHYSSAWIGMVLTVVLYAAGAFIGLYAFPEGEFKMTATIFLGFAMASFGYVFFLPRYLFAAEMIEKEIEPLMVERLGEITKMNIEDAVNSGQMSRDEADQIIDRMNKSTQEEKNDEEDESDE